MATVTFTPHRLEGGESAIVSGPRGHVWVSSVDHNPHAPINETMVFECDEDGNPTNWIELWVTIPRDHTAGIEWAKDYVDLIRG